MAKSIWIGIKATPQIHIFTTKTKITSALDLPISLCPAILCVHFNVCFWKIGNFCILVDVFFFATDAIYSNTSIYSVVELKELGWLRTAKKRMQWTSAHHSQYLQGQNIPELMMCVCDFFQCMCVCVCVLAINFSMFFFACQIFTVATAHSQTYCFHVYISIIPVFLQLGVGWLLCLVGFNFFHAMAECWVRVVRYVRCFSFHNFSLSFSISSTAVIACQ